MRQRKRGFKLSIKIVSILSVIAIASVGFASWLIINLPNETEQSSGSFKVYEVQDQTVTFENFTWDADTQIRFGAPQTPATNLDYNWLVAPSGSEKVENLSAGFNFDVKIADASAGVDDAVKTITIELAANNDAKLRQAFNDGYIKAFIYVTDGTSTEKVAYDPTSAASVLYTVPTNSAQTINLEVTLGFEWNFGGTNTNPYNYFNKYSYAEKAAEAKTALEVLEGITTADGQFVFSISAQGVN